LVRKPGATAQSLFLREGPITSKEWEAFLDDFQLTLDKFAFPTEEQAELKTIVNSNRSDIVVD
jgi:hypothetical protein